MRQNSSLWVTLCVTNKSKTWYRFFFFGLSSRIYYKLGYRGFSFSNLDKFGHKKIIFWYFGGPVNDTNDQKCHLIHKAVIVGIYFVGFGHHYALMTVIDSSVAPSILKLCKFYTKPIFIAIKSYNKKGSTRNSSKLQNNDTTKYWKFTYMSRWV